MNADAYYEHPAPHAAEQARDAALTEAELSALARHGDPSLIQRGTAPPPVGGRSIAWVRPSDLVTTLASPMLQRGADLQAGLVRQARRAPSAATRAGRRITRSAIARAVQVSPSQEGLGL